MRTADITIDRALRGGASVLAIALLSISAPGAFAQTEAGPTQTESPPASGTGGEPDETVDADAQAQTATEGGEIVVTGLRQSLQSAQAIKRNADQFVDSITAQDIGRLPDVNVAEALQRVSGVQITRSRGEGSGIAVRGLTQVRTELNGRDIFSASGGRGLSWEEVGSELLAGVDVYKNPSADLIEGGLSGTVNLRTRLPFDQAGELIAATGGVTYYDLAEKSGQQVSGIYSNRWETGIGEIGFLANVGYQTTAFREDKVYVEPFWRHGPAATGVQSPVPGYENQTVLLPHGGGFAIATGDRERLSGAVALQWRPSDSLEFYAQYFRADYQIFDKNNSFASYGNDVQPAAGTNFTVDDAGIVRTGFLNNPAVDSVAAFSDRETSTTDISGGVKWKITDNLRLTVDYQHIDSTVEVETLNLTASALNPRTSVAGLGQAYNLYFDIGGDLPLFQSTTPNYFGNLANYGMTAILPYAEDNDASSDALRADLVWDFGEDSFIRDVRVGGRYTDKEAINRNTTYGTWTAIGQSCANWSGDCTLLSDFPQYAQPNQYQPGLFRGKLATQAFGPVWQFADNLALNSQAAFDALRGITGQDISFRPFDDPTAFLGTIGEKTYAAYVRVGFGGDIGTVRFDGNVGLRAVRTETQAQGLRVLGYRDPRFVDTDPNATIPTITQLEEFSGGRNYDKYLPSVNLKVNLTDNLLIRGAFSQNFSRPSFSQLNPQFNLSPTYTNTTDAAGNAVRPVVPDRLNPSLPYNAGTNPYIGTGTALGDPNLLPEEATSYDLAAEWYFDSVGFVYITGFYKDLKNLLVLRPTAPLTVDVAGVGPVQFNVERWINQASGYVRGFEIGGQKFFDFLPGALSGLGVQANYTFADSDAGQTAAGDLGSSEQVSVGLVNLSKHSYNLVGLYDKYGLNMRLAYNWRSDYLQATNNTGTQNLPIFGKGYGVLDASVTYDVTPQFAITVDGQNLLDTTFKTYQIFDDRPRDFVINDRRFSVRARVKF